MPAFRDIHWQGWEAPAHHCSGPRGIPCHQLQAVTNHMKSNLNLQAGTCIRPSHNQRNQGTYLSRSQIQPGQSLCSKPLATSDPEQDADIPLELASPSPSREWEVIHQERALYKAGSEKPHPLLVVSFLKRPVSFISDVKSLLRGGVFMMLMTSRQLMGCGQVSGTTHCPKT